MSVKTEPKIKLLTGKKLIGKRLRMSLAQNKTTILWRSFIREQTHISNKVNTELISMQVYSELLRLGDMHQSFDKWAAVEVTNFSAVPESMETFMLEGGLYAVFYYQGLNTDTKIFKYIFGEWLPNSQYNLDNRPHFEILGEKYKNGDPNSEEEIWIPIKLKK